MRLFVSVEPSAAAVTALTEALDALDLGPARLVPTERWHVTLAFLGEVGDQRLPALSQALQGVAAGAPAMRLQLSGAGAFPARGRPSVLWVGVSGDVEPLRRLAVAVARASRQAGVRLERRRFAPHLTIARYRQAPAGAATLAVAGLTAHTGPPFAVERLQLMRSHLGPRPRHEEVAAWRLGDQGGGESG